MKAQNNTQETVLSQVKSSVLRASAVICSVALISLTVNAQDLWEQFSTSSTYGKMAMSMVDQSSETKKIDAVFEAIDAEISTRLNHSSETFVYEAFQEEELQIESWMFDESNFTSHPELNYTEKEESIKVEDWMISNSNFSNVLITEKADYEKSLEIESWMTDEDIFNTGKTLTSEEEDRQIESWMLDNRNFDSSTATEKANENESMQLEAWMINNQFWAF